MTIILDTHTGGYGTVPQMVMRDKDLTSEAKAIFGYIASFAGSKNSAYPSVSLICHELNMSPERYRKHRKGLVDKGYLTIQSIATSNGKFSNNLYVINRYITIESNKETKATEREQPLPDFTAKETMPTDANRTGKLTP